MDAPQSLIGMFWSLVKINPIIAVVPSILVIALMVAFSKYMAVAFKKGEYVELIDAGGYLSAVKLVLGVAIAVFASIWIG